MIKNISSSTNQTNFTQYSSQIKFFQSNLCINTFTFYYFEGFGNYSTLSLAHQFPEEDLSLIHQLYKSNIIESKSFSFVKDEKNTTFLNFGGIPEKFTNLKFTGKCKVNNTNNTSSWGCGVMQLNIQNKNFTL